MLWNCCDGDPRALQEEAKQKSGLSLPRTTCTLRATTALPEHPCGCRASIPPPHPSSVRMQGEQGQAQLSCASTLLARAAECLSHRDQDMGWGKGSLALWCPGPYEFKIPPGMSPDPRLEHPAGTHSHRAGKGRWGHTPSSSEGGVPIHGDIVKTRRCGT